MKTIILFAFSFICVLSLQAQDTLQSYSPILFIYDASGSMWGKLDNKTKKETAAEVLSSAIQNLPEDQTIGLIAYGHRRKKDCRDIEFMADLNNDSKEKVIDAIKGINPLGRTPLAYSANMAIDSLRTSKTKATIILVTDGIESCDGDICKVIEDAKAEGIDFKLHIIGFGLKSGETEQLKCAAKAGEGNYYDAADATGLSEVLTEATVQTVDEQAPNFGVFAVKNGVAIDAWVKAYDTQVERKPIALRTYQDTGYVYLPPSTYDLEVNPLEGSQVKPLMIKGVTSLADTIIFKEISFDAAKFNFNMTNNGEGWDCTVIVLDQEGKQAGRTRTYGRSKSVEINPGVYDIKIQALKIKGLATDIMLEDVELNGGTQDISHEFKSGTLFIKPTVNGEIIDTVTKFFDVSSGTEVAAGRSYTRGVEHILNPGTYKVEVKAIGKHKDKGKKTITVEVPQGERVSKEVAF